MSDPSGNPFLVTLDLLMASVVDLYSLAKMSGMSVPEFYQDADLRGLDLRNQDLRGLNFDGADLRSAKLGDTKHDEGAFNNSLVNSSDVVVDRFDISYEDVYNIFVSNQRAWFLVEFRESSLESAIRRGGLNYYETARLMGITEATLRNARRGLPVTRVTAESILKTIHELVFGSKLNDVQGRFLGVDYRSSQEAWARQPAVRIVESSSNGGVQDVWPIYKYILLKNARVKRLVTWDYN